MFKTIILRRQNQNDEVKPVDLGFLAEAMLFYEDVHLLADYGIVQQLVRYCSSDIGVLFALMDEGFLKIDFLESVVAVKTLNTGTLAKYTQPLSPPLIPGSCRMQHQLSSKMF